MTIITLWQHMAIQRIDEDLPNISSVLDPLNLLDLNPVFFSSNSCLNMPNFTSKKSVKPKTSSCKTSPCHVLHDTKTEKEIN